MLPLETQNHTALHSARIRLLELKQTIQALESQLDEARRSKIITEQQIVALEQSSTTLSLPNEILLDIFEYLLAQDSAPKQRDTLRLVCKTWDAFFENGRHPSLWADISIHVPQTLNRLHHCLKFCLKCLHLSGAHPLRIILVYNHTSVLSPIEAASLPHCSKTEVIILKLPLLILQGPEGTHMRRWESFAITGASKSRFLNLYLDTFVQYPTPMLREYTIDARYHEITRHSIYQLQSPNLNRICLYRVIGTIRGYYHLTLQHLEFIGCSESTLEVLINFPNLITLSLGDTNVSPGYNWRAWKHGAEVGEALPCLKTVSISGLVPVNFWTTIQLPVLESVHFEWSEKEETRVLTRRAVESFEAVPKSTFPRFMSMVVDESLKDSEET